MICRKRKKRRGLQQREKIGRSKERKEERKRKN
jgi:hypothetical protein